jgi:hypothetical protein
MLTMCTRWRSAPGAASAIGRAASVCVSRASRASPVSDSRALMSVPGAAYATHRSSLQMLLVACIDRHGMHRRLPGSLCLFGGVINN